MEWFVRSIPEMIADPDLAFSTLLHLVPGGPEEPLNASSNPLFDEDPINEYAEDVVLLQHVSKCLGAMLHEHKVLPQRLILDCVSPKRPEGIKQTVEEDGDNSVWGNPKQFMKLVKQYFLQGAVRNAGNIQETHNQEESTQRHPIFI